jgi:hypothetical protein
VRACVCPLVCVGCPQVGHGGVFRKKYLEHDIKLDVSVLHCANCVDVIMKCVE